MTLAVPTVPGLPFPPCSTYQCSKAVTCVSSEYSGLQLTQFCTILFLAITSSCLIRSASFPYGGGIVTFFLKAAYWNVGRKYEGRS